MRKDNDPALTKMTARYQALREEDERKGGVRLKYVAARQRFAAFLKAQERNEVLLKLLLERLGEANAALHVLQADKEKVGVAVEEAKDTLEAMQTGIEAAAEPTSRSGHDSPQTRKSAMRNNAVKNDESNRETVVGLGADPLKCSSRL